MKIHVYMYKEYIKSNYSCQLKSFTDPLCISVPCKRYKDIAIFIRFVSQDKQACVYDLVRIS